ncbi:MAG: YggT family protein [Legionellaceae bacterium]|nr:YggT family protein [Legionellaceae bacterium]
MEGVIAAGYFIFTLIFGVLTFTLWLRFVLRYLRISSMHPISQLVLKLTNPVIRPVSKLANQNTKRLNRYDWPCFAVLVIAEIIKFTLIGLIFFGQMLPFILLILYPIADLIIQPLNLLFYAIFIRVIMSWINPNWQNPLNDLLAIVTEPVLRPIQKRIPPISGFDFSPFIVLVLIKVVTVFVGSALPMHLI